MYKKPVIAVVCASWKDHPTEKLKRFLRSLRKKYVDVQLIYPSTTNIDLSNVDALFFFAYDFPTNARRRAYGKLRTELVDLAKKQGIPTFPGRDMFHTEHWGLWEKNNIRCPKYKSLATIKDLEDLHFEYPVLLRQDRKMSGGKGIYFAGNLQEAQKIYEEHSVDLATEFNDVRSEDGYIRKYRSWVIGDKVLHQYVTISKSWKINLMDGDPAIDNIAAEESQLLRDHELYKDELTRALHVLPDVHFGAFDYSIVNDDVIIWEVNANAGMSGCRDRKQDYRVRRSTSKGRAFWRNYWVTCYDAIVDNILNSIYDDDHDVCYIFWTGGLDSTYRLAQLVVEGKTVQPIYISANIDVRRNNKYELEAMENLISTLNLLDAPGNVLPLMNIERVPKNATVSKQAKRIGYGPERGWRMGAQYAAMCLFAESFPYPIEMGIEIGGRAERLFRHRTMGVGHECQVDPNKIKSLPDLMIFRNIRFPILHMTKEEIGEALIKLPEGQKIFDQTFTCWFPDKATTGTECGKCEMCKSRKIAKKAAGLL